VRIGRKVQTHSDDYLLLPSEQRALLERNVCLLLGRGPASWVALQVGVPLPEVVRIAQANGIRLKPDPGVLVSDS
jgi:hypothetical protein